MIRGLKVLLLCLCITSVISIKVGAAQPTSPNDSPNKEKIEQLRGEMKELQQQLAPLHVQMKQLMAQVKALREKMRPIVEKMKSARQQLRALHGEGPRHQIQGNNQGQEQHPVKSITNSVTN